jgi:cell division protein FtsQ
VTPTTTRPRPATGAARSRAGMDPRISARRTAVTREHGRRRLHVLMGLLIATGVLVGMWFLLHTSLFSARSVTVVGAVHETPAQVVQAAGLAGHPPLLNVNAAAVVAGIERLPWVASATVHVSWPDGVRISVIEATPRLVMSLPGAKWAVLSTDGRVLSVGVARPAGMILVNGPQVAGAPGTKLGPRDQAALKVASSLPLSFSAQVTGVTVEPAGWVQLAMSTPILVDIGTATQLPAKYEDVSSILSGAPLLSGDVIDVSVPDAPTVTEG